MKKQKSNRTQRKSSSATQQEDAALKVCMQFFADELLPYLGIEGEVVSPAPTELIHLDLQKLFQDFNLVMRDNSWKHFEFQSTHEGLNGLKRFRVYEALTSYQYKVQVTTYVLFSGNIKQPMTEFTEGVNTYRIVPIIMLSKNADTLITDLQRKIDMGEPITKKDLTPLTLCLPMGGEMSLKERVASSYNIISKAGGVPKEDIHKLEAVIYTMADKFLDSTELDEIKEAIRMTTLGQILVNEGYNEGWKSNQLENARNFLGKVDDATIAECIGIPLETVLKLKEEAALETQTETAAE